MTRHVNVLRAHKDATALTEDQLRSRVPSIFAQEAHGSRSDRYTYIPTINVMQGLAKEGFLPVAARQCSPRDDTRHEFAKHMIRFRRPDQKYGAVGDVLPELVLVNSHDGTSSYNLMAGLFRLACMNGLVVEAGEIASVRVGHKGDIVSKVIEGAYTVLDESVKALEAPRDWSQLQLTGSEQHVLAEQAHAMRFADADGVITTAIKPQQLLVPRRYDDKANDLWRTFNVVQENVIRGGLSAMGRDANNRPRRSTSRAVNGIDQDVKLNKALWALASKMAELKKAS